MLSSQRLRERDERGRRRCARCDARKLERVGERLAAMRERGAHDVLHAREVVRHRCAAESDERRVDVRPRTKDRARDGMEACPLAHELHEHGDCAVRLRVGRGEEPVGDLALHHHTPQGDVGKAVEALRDDRCRDVVGQVGHELRRILRQLDPERVAEEHVDVVAELVQHRLELRVDLDRMHVADALGEIARQHSVSRADLEDDVLRSERGEPADDAEDVLVDEEVLPVFLLHSPKYAAALASIRPSSSAASPPRACASAARVYMTYAGSLRRPRADWGARYGESVSARIRSAGTWLAARRSSLAFGNVALPANDTYQPRSSAVGSSRGEEKQCRTTVPSSAERAASVSSSAARVWMTTGFPSSAARPSWDSNIYRCASGVA